MAIRVYGAEWVPEDCILITDLDSSGFPRSILYKPGPAAKTLKEAIDCILQAAELLPNTKNSIYINELQLQLLEKETILKLEDLYNNS